MENESFAVTKNTNIFSRIINSFIGTFIGILLFLAAFPVLFWNEGRADQYSAFKEAKEVQVSENLEENKLYAIKGKLNSTIFAKDNQFSNISKESLVLTRKVEMYSWNEESNNETKTSLGGNQETKTTYKYSTSWEESPDASANFQQSENHINPTKSLESKIFYAQDVKLGNYTIDISKLALPELIPLKGLEVLSPTTSTPTLMTTIMPSLTDSITPTLVSNISDGDYIFSGKGSLNEPQIGDIRISYSYLTNNSEVLLFGQKNGNAITTFKAKNGIEVYRAFNVSYTQALEMVKVEDNTLTWILRAIGFFMMFIGLTMMAGLLTTLSDVIPLFGKITGCFVSILALIISLILTTITILISIAVHNIFILITCLVLLIAIIGIALYFAKKKSK